MVRVSQRCGAVRPEGSTRGTLSGQHMRYVVRPIHEVRCRGNTRGTLSGQHTRYVVRATHEVRCQGSTRGTLSGQHTRYIVRVAHEVRCQGNTRGTLSADSKKCIKASKYIKMSDNSNWHALQIKPGSLHNQDDNNIPIGTVSRTFPKYLNRSRNTT